MQVFMRQKNLTDRINACAGVLHGITPVAVSGRIVSVSGLVVEIAGLSGQAYVGDQLQLFGRDGDSVRAEVAGFRDGLAQVLPFGNLDGLGPGQSAMLLPRTAGSLAVSDFWLGRVVDPLGRAMDGKGPVPPGNHPRPIAASPPEATSRARLGERITLGVRALDLFTTCRTGQRLGLFSGSGVGKSTLFAMLARAAVCDVAVIALVGERGREVREFLEDDLGTEGGAGAPGARSGAGCPGSVGRRRRHVGQSASPAAASGLYRDGGRRAFPRS